jgi:hypothetical protein
VLCRSKSSLVYFARPFFACNHTAVPISIVVFDERGSLPMDLYLLLDVLFLATTKGLSQASPAKYFGGESRIIGHNRTWAKPLYCIRYSCKCMRCNRVVYQVFYWVFVTVTWFVGRGKFGVDGHVNGKEENEEGVECTECRI